jgi:hypothetical protein
VAGGAAVVKGVAVVMQRPWWGTHDRKLWGDEDWIAYYVQTGHLTPDERRRLNVAGADDKPVELMTSGLTWVTTSRWALRFNWGGLRTARGIRSDVSVHPGEGYPETVRVHGHVPRPPRRSNPHG